MQFLAEQAKKYVPLVKEIAAFHPQGTNIRAITYETPPVFQKKYKTFAYLGIPDLPGRIPAVVLVHGGNGHAYLEWVKIWNTRGYAAIAMDLEGYYPETVNAGAHWTDGTWHHGEYGIFDTGEAPSPQNDRMEKASRPLEEQWMAHAVLKIIAARAILREMPQIGEIGICGVSWGGVIAAITVGYDDRFSFAIPIYGAGFLDESLSNLGSYFRTDAVKNNWLAQNRFSKFTMPTLWIAWDDDPNFSANVNSRSFLATRDGNPQTGLALIHAMQHSHIFAAERQEVYRFADAAVKGGKPYPKLENTKTGCRVLYADSVKSATLYYITAPMTYEKFDKFGAGEYMYMAQSWQKAPCAISGNDITVTIPQDAVCFYIAVETESENSTCIITTELRNGD